MQISAWIDGFMRRAERAGLSWILLASACAFLVAAGGWRALVTELSTDFVPVYVGGKCLLDHCNPYDTTQVERELFQSGAKPQDFGDNPHPVYPPSTFAVVLPFTIVSYGKARALWFVFSVMIFCAAAYATVGLCSLSTRTIGIVLVSILTIGSTGDFGNPAFPAIGLAVIAMWLLLRTRRWIFSALLLGLSIALKPHVAGPLLAWLVLQNKYRRAGWLSAAVSAFLLFASIAWLDRSPASANWLSFLRSNLANASAAGGINDPTIGNPDGMRMTNLQAALGVVQPDSRFDNGAAEALTAVCFGIWLVAVLRAGPSEEARFLEIAVLACLTLLPVYHRLYDARILLLTIPALAWLLVKRRWAGLVAACLTMPVLFSLAFHLQLLFERRWHTSVASLNVFMRLLWARQAPIALLALTLLYLWVLWSFRRPAAEHTALDVGEDKIRGFAGGS
jgi:LPXTG-motif cell wall-anchored protein